MTKEEAIIELKIKLTCTIGGLSKEEYNATVMAIEALTHDIHTDTHGVCSDLISRAEPIGYAEWLESMITATESFEWLCEDDEAVNREWCNKNCKYLSIQAECLRHIYEHICGKENQ